VDHVLVLFICAINSKEMAAVIPVLILLYEGILESKRQYLSAVVGGALTILFGMAKTRAGSALSGKPCDAMSFTGSQFLAHSQKL
jgi:hypothetical protein